MGCVGAILVLLKFNNKPMPTMAYGLTFNGIISILAVLAKSSMILPVAETIGQLKMALVLEERAPDHGV